MREAERSTSCTPVLQSRIGPAKKKPLSDLTSVLHLSFHGLELYANYLWVGRISIHERNVATCNFWLNSEKAFLCDFQLWVMTTWAGSEAAAARQETLTVWFTCILILKKYRSANIDICLSANVGACVECLWTFINDDTTQEKKKNSSQRSDRRGLKSSHLLIVWIAQFSDKFRKKKTSNCPTEI